MQIRPGLPALCLMVTSLRRIFERKANLRISKTKKKPFLFRFSPVFGLKVGEDQKKGLHSDLVRGPKIGEDQKKNRSSLIFSPAFGPKVGEDQTQKKVFSQILFVCVLKLCAKLIRGGMP